MKHLILANIIQPAPAQDARESDEYIELSSEQEKAARLAWQEGWLLTKDFEIIEDPEKVAGVKIEMAKAFAASEYHKRKSSGRVSEVGQSRGEALDAVAALREGKLKSAKEEYIEIAVAARKEAEDAEKAQ